MTASVAPSVAMPHRTINPALAVAERRAAGLSLGTATVLMAVKFLAYGLTGSSAIFSDALESIVNVLAGAFALYAVILAHRPADASHPYGHGKVEFLSAGFEGGMILLAAVFIAWRGAESLIRGPKVERLDAGLVLMSAAMLVNAVVGLLLVRWGRRNGSITLEADGQHLLSDAVTSVAVLTALGLVLVTGWTQADPLCALLVAAYLVWVAIDLLKRSAAGLMDEQDASDDALIRQILDAHTGPTAPPPRLCSYHHLRHRHSGRYHWVDFHLVLPASLTIEEGHNIASALEGEIERALGPADATAHIEPCHSADCRACEKPSRAVGSGP